MDNICKKILLISILVCILPIYTNGHPVRNCTGDIGIEFVKHMYNECVFYLCVSGSFYADPSSGDFEMPCPPGTSTRDANPRSNDAPCTHHTFRCKGGQGKKTTPTTTTQPPMSTTMKIETTTKVGEGPRTTPYQLGYLDWHPDKHAKGGRHLQGFTVDGGPYIGVTSRQLCHWSCHIEQQCIAFDWNRKTKSCWIHTFSTACDSSAREDKPYCEHVVIRACDPDSRPSTTALPPSSTTKRSPPTTMSTTEAPKTDHPITGFMAKYINGHKMNGRLVLKGRPVEDCLTYCKLTGTCSGVDYYEFTSSCYLHGKAHACHNVTYKDGCTHYRRLACHEGTDDDGYPCPIPMCVDRCPNGFVYTEEGCMTCNCKDDGVPCAIPMCAEHCSNGYAYTEEGCMTCNCKDTEFGMVKLGMHLFGGTLLCNGMEDCNLQYCQNMCMKDPQCAAIDYNHDSYNPACFTHDRSGLCTKKLKPQDGVIHYRKTRGRMACVSDSSSDYSNWHK